MKNRRLLLSAAVIAASAGLAQAQSFTEDFETTALGGFPATWVNHNQSVPGPGLVTWNAQSPGVFPPHGGAVQLTVNYNSGTGLSTLSNWLIMQPVTLNNGDTISFWTQTNPAQVYPDRLQLRMSTAGASENTGATELDVGDFTTLLVDVNPTYTTTGYPGTYTQFTGVVSGLGGPTLGRFAFRYFVENGGPAGANSDYIGVDDVVYTATGGGPVGACCLPATMTCAIAAPAACTAQGGTYRGDGTACATANCPTPGACCRPDGSCFQATPAACTAATGVYRGDSTSCATANCPGGFTMDCNIPATFTDIASTGTPFVFTNFDDEAQAFTSSVTNALVTNPNLYVCTNGFISDSAAFNTWTNTALPTASAVFAIFPNWDDLYIDAPGSVVQQALVENGVPVHIIQWNQANTFANSGAGGPRGTFQVKIFGAGGPALVQFIYQDMVWDWNGNSSTVGVQWSATASFQKSFSNFNVAPPPPGQIPDNSHCSIVQTGVATCYANCDHSTQAPCLNVLDFGCFLNAFAANSSYANCDNSTQIPVLNVLDFGCFLNRFAAGCSNC